MMRMTQGWCGLRTAVIALALFAGTSTVVKANELLTYSTSVGAGSFSSGITGANVINYDALTNATINLSSNLPFGSLQVEPLQDGQMTTYTNTPININIIPGALNGTSLAESTPLTIHGVLNGSIMGSTASTVSVTFSPFTDGTFQLDGASSTLSMLQTMQLLVPSSAANGITTLEGVIKTAGSPGEVPAPEPSTIALFFSTVGGLGLRKFVLARRKRSQA
jgi:hypothetical protein